MLFCSHCASFDETVSTLSPDDDEDGDEHVASDDEEDSEAAALLNRAQRSRHFSSGAHRTSSTDWGPMDLGGNVMEAALPPSPASPPDEAPNDG